jgi:hypothetical protein
MQNRGEDMFKVATGNENLHQDNNDNVGRVAQSV